MKYIQVTCLLMGLMLASSCESPSSNTPGVAESKDPLEGTWEFVSSKVVLPDTTILYDIETAQQGVFMMKDGLFAFVSANAEKTDLTYAGYGSYTVEGNTFTEKIDFHSATTLIGKSTKWEYEIEGEKLIKRGSLPVWADIKPFAGDEKEVQFEEVRKRIKG